MRNLFTTGYNSSVARFVMAFLVMILVLLLGAVLRALATPKDNTAPGDSRSGMVLYVDAATGCNYLSSGRQYGITPRLRRDGSHWCDDPQQRAQ